MGGSRPGSAWKTLRAFCNLHECYLHVFGEFKGTVVLATFAH